ncbi:MAG: BamA/TamA family outer membrane protein [Halioglobus sp.]
MSLFKLQLPLSSLTTAQVPRRVLSFTGSMMMASVMVVASGMVNAGSFMEDLIDPDDGWLDGGKFLLEYPYAVLPVPIIITEPAVGEGLGVAAAHFHDAPKDAPVDGLDSRGRAMPRSISAVALGATNNDTKFIGGGHFGHYKQDSIRYEGVVGYADVFMDFYGSIDEPNEEGFSFNSEALILSQVLAFRLGESDWFVGGAYRLISTDSRFDLHDGDPGIDPETLDSNNAAVAAIIRYDSLDNQYAPKTGIVSDLQLARFDEAVGGDFNYNQYTWLNQVHLPLADDWVLGLRLDGDMASGDVPFYAVPYIELKGIPALRYQGKKVVTTEARLNWQLHPRWQLAAFVGAGRVSDDMDGLNEATSRVSRGVGFRYLGVKKLGMNMGLDFAKGPEDEVIYISFGTRW